MIMMIVLIRWMIDNNSNDNDEIIMMITINHKYDDEK